MNNQQLEKARGIFLADMINYYGEDTSRRSVSGDMCVYRAPNGNKCQIGRYIPDDKCRPEYEGCGVDRVLELLPRPIQILGLDFLKECQGFHDEDLNWGALTGLSNLGAARARSIIYRFNLIMPPLLNGKYIIESETNPPSYIEDFIKAMEFVDCTDTISLV